MGEGSEATGLCEHVHEEAPVAKPTLEAVRRLESAMLETGDGLPIDQLTRHFYCDGIYAREFFHPADTYLVGKMHRKENFFVLLAGEVTLWTEHGMKRVRAPFWAITKPGTKRVAYAHTDSIVMTFHPNDDNEQDLSALEARYTVPSDAEEAFHALTHTEVPALEDANR